MTLDTSGIAATSPEAATQPSEVDAPQPRSLTTQQILEMLTGTERVLDALAEYGQDAANLVDELELGEAKSEEALALLGPKIDGIRFVYTEFEAYAARTQERADLLAAKATAAANQAARIKARLLYQMEFFGFERLPGVEFRVERIRASNPRCEPTRPPTALDLLLTPEYVKTVPETYSWKKDEIKAAIKAGATHSFAELKYTYSVEFQERDRPDVPAKKKKKGKSK